MGGGQYRLRKNGGGNKMKIPDFTIMIPFTKIKNYFKNKDKKPLDPEKEVDIAYAEYIKQRDLLLKKQSKDNDSQDD